MHKESELVVEYIRERQKERQSPANYMEIAANALKKKSLENTSEVEFGMGIFLAGIYQAVDLVVTIII